MNTSVNSSCRESAMALCLKEWHAWFQITRNILADKPRVTRFNIQWHSDQQVREQREKELEEAMDNLENLEPGLHTESMSNQMDNSLAPFMPPTTSSKKEEPMDSLEKLFTGQSWDTTPLSLTITSWDCALWIHQNSVPSCWNCLDQRTFQNSVAPVWFHGGHANFWVVQRLIYWTSLCSKRVLTICKTSALPVWQKIFQLTRQKHWQHVCYFCY